MKEFLITILNFLGLAWWVQIVTQNPTCTYYFGPFLTAKEAQVAQEGYVEDLQEEGAQDISIAVKRCKPSLLTVSDDLGERVDRKASPAYS